MSFDQFPELKDVCLRMAYDNGGINRERPEADFLAAASKVIFDREMPPGYLDQCEAWLATLGDEQRDVAAAGEHTEVVRLMKTSPHHPFLDGLLNDVFEEAV